MRLQLSRRSTRKPSKYLTWFSRAKGLDLIPDLGSCRPSKMPRLWDTSGTPTDTPFVLGSRWRAHLSKRYKNSPVIRRSQCQLGTATYHRDIGFPSSTGSVRRQSEAHVSITSTKSLIFSATRKTIFAASEFRFSKVMTVVSTALVKAIGSQSLTRERTRSSLSGRPSPSYVLWPADAWLTMYGCRSL